MGHRGDDRLSGLEFVPRHEVEVILFLRLVDVRERVVHLHREAVALELAHDLDDL